MDRYNNIKLKSHLVMVSNKMKNKALLYSIQFAGDRMNKKNFTKDVPEQ